MIWLQAKENCGITLQRDHAHRLSSLTGVQSMLTTAMACQVTALTLLSGFPVSSPYNTVL